MSVEPSTEALPASRGFQVMAKPTGAICNLDCDYCYYLKKEDLYPGTRSFRMERDVMERYVAQHIQASPDPVIDFSWHGGEPTILGIDYFREVVALQRKHCPPGRRVRNGMQTNGVLLDDEWCRFLAEEGFSIGLSLDGPEKLHDEYRVTKGRQPTHRQAVQAFARLKAHKVPCDVLCVVHAGNAGRPTEVYRYFKGIGADHMQFIPLVEPAPGDAAASPGGAAGQHVGPDLVEPAPGGAAVSSRSVPAEAFGDFLCAVFDEWIRNDVGRVTVQIFDEAARTGLGIEHALCIFRETCGDVPVVEHNGDFYSCDHYVDPGHLVGNIRDTPLARMIDGDAQRRFGRDKWTSLPRYCRGCEVRAQCNGGCPKDRFIETPDGEPGLNYLCAGYKKFFLHSREHLGAMAGLWRAGEPIEKVMRLVREADAAARPQAGRNDPCPCGSGRKYKRCCLPR